MTAPHDQDPKGAEQQHTWKIILRSFLSGTLGGCIAKVSEYPLDTIKVRIQSTPDRYKTAFHAAQTIIEYEGFGAFYKGMTSPLIGCMLDNAVVFSFYGWACSVYQKKYGKKKAIPLPVVYALGGMAGTMSAFIYTPLELIKCRLQAQAHIYNSPLEVIQKVMKVEGVTGFYRGLITTLGREVLGTSAWFGTYEFITRGCYASMNTTREKLGAFSYFISMIAGGCAGVVYWTIPYPLDVVKSRMQTYDQRGMWPQIVEIWQKQGIAGFYRGLGITAFRAVPANAILFCAVEYFQAFFKRAFPD